MAGPLKCARAVSGDSHGRAGPHRCAGATHTLRSPAPIRRQLGAWSLGHWQTDAKTDASANARATEKWSSHAHHPPPQRARLHCKAPGPTAKGGSLANVLQIGSRARGRARAGPANGCSSVRSAARAAAARPVPSRSRSQTPKGGTQKISSLVATQERARQGGAQLGVCNTPAGPNPVGGAPTLGSRPHSKKHPGRRARAAPPGVGNAPRPGAVSRRGSWPRRCRRGHVTRRWRAAAAPAAARRPAEGRVRP